MPEALVVYEVGERFATITRDGRAAVWEVDEGGRPNLALGLEPKDEVRLTYWDDKDSDAGE